MSYDDVANHAWNPFPGKLYNKPDPNGPGHDVYKGCKIDYRLSECTADNFISVLTGDEEAVRGKGTGRVLKSNENDHVFINFVDHGGVGLIAFPVGGYLYADALNSAL